VSFKFIAFIIFVVLIVRFLLFAFRGGSRRSFGDSSMSNPDNVAIIALSSLAVCGCAAVNSYQAAARSLDWVSESGTGYCWVSRASPNHLPCQTEAARPDQNRCVDSLRRSNGPIHSRNKSMHDLVACMREHGWSQEVEFEMTY
jgi:hypothetical protein